MSLIPSFHDAERGNLVVSLVDSIKLRKKAFEDNQPTPNMLITITAPNGWGKTRLIQEVYKRLALDSEFNKLPIKRQSESRKKNVRFSGYWPEDFADTDHIAQLNLEQSRKLIYPVNFERKKETIPAFMWIGIECQNKQNIKDIIASFEQHRAYLYDSAYFTSSNTERYLASLRELSFEGIKDNLIGLIPDLALSAVNVSCGGIVETIIKKARGLNEENKKRNNRLKKEGQINSQEEILLNSIKPIVSSGVPFIICLEDFQEADLELVKALFRCLELEGPVIILATQVKQSKIFPSIDLGDINLLQYSNLSEEKSKRLLPLSTSSIIALIKQYYPNTSNEHALLIGEMYNTPLLSQLVMELPVVKRKATNNAITFSLIDKLGIPPKIEAIYAIYFSDLNEDTQKLLAVLATMTSTMGKKWSDVFERNLRVVLDDVDGQGVYEDTRLNWCTRTHKDVYKFYSNIHEQLCLNRTQDFFDDSEIVEIAKALIKKIAREPIDALDEKSVELVDNILRKIITSEMSLNDDLSSICKAILEFGLARNKAFDDYCQALMNDFDLEYIPMDLSLLGFEYTRGKESIANYSFWNFIGYLKITVAARDIDFVMKIIAKIDIPFPPYCNVPKPQADNDIFQRTVSSEMHHLSNSDVYDQFDSYEIEEMLEPVRSIENEIQMTKTWLLQSIFENVAENTSKSPVIAMFARVCWHRYPNLPKKIQNLDLAKPLMEEISERIDHENKIEIEAKKIVWQKMNDEAEEAIVKIEEDFSSLKDNKSIMGRLKRAGEIERWKKVLHSIEMAKNQRC
jgi:hypothetical protein